MSMAIDFGDILVPTDGSDSATAAAEQAVRLASGSDATLHVLYAMNMGDAGYVAVPSDIEETRNRLEEKGREFTGDVAEMAEEAGVEYVTAVKANTPVEAIQEYVEDNGVDLVVMGKRGRSDPDKPLFGSITERVIGSLDVPVFTS